MSASAPASSAPLPRSFRMRAGFDVMTCSAVASGTPSCWTASRTSAKRLVTRPMPMPRSFPCASKSGRLPCPSDVKVMWAMFTPASSIRRRPVLDFTSPSARNAGTVDVVKSTNPPAFAQAMPSSKSAGLRLMCVGRNCVTGISVSAMMRRSSASPRGPSPMCTFTTPALPDRRPPRRASAATRANWSKVGCVDRWSESATSPTPMTLSMISKSRSMLPVMPCTGTA